MSYACDNSSGPTIELLSDDDDNDVTFVESIRKKKAKISKIPSACLNIQCKFGNEFIEGVPEFVLVYFKVRKKKGLKVCEKCFDEACSYYKGLKEKLINKKSICSTPCPPYTSVLNIDSDEEDLSPEEEEEPLDADTMVIIKEDLADIMTNVITKYNLSFQVNDARNVLQSNIQTLKKESDDYCLQLDNVQAEIDRIRRLIYEDFPINITNLPAIDIDDDGAKSMEIEDEKKPAVVEEPTALQNSEIEKRLSPALGPSVNQIARKSVTGRLSATNNTNLQKEKLTEAKENQDVVAVSEEVMSPPSNLPEVDQPIAKPRLTHGDVVYAMKHNYKYPWKQGVIVGISNDKGYNEYHLKVDVVNPKKTVPTTKLTGKSIAYSTLASFRFPVGARIIAIFKDEVHPHFKLQYYSGTIAEPPKVMNKFRYLVFFDDGCAQYVPHQNLRLICESSPNAWDDVPPDSRVFMKNYLLKYPERPMVKLQIGNSVKVEFQNVWYLAQVAKIDGSLVKMTYVHNRNSEWIYRGSTRLAPLFKEIEAAKHRMQTGDRVRKIGGKHNIGSVPYVEYTHHADNDEVEEPRAVARKSTAANKDHKRTDKPVKWSPSPIPGKVEEKRIITYIFPKKFGAHQCCPTCINWTEYQPDKIRNTGPLAIPLHFGFRRLISTFSGGKHNVIYKAPCGRQLRNMEEVHLYLRITKSQMTVDYFDFDYWVRCQAEFVIQRCNINVADISQKKEKCPISCVNYIDSKLPDFYGYMTERSPRANVTLNLDPEFLCGCDCTDDCQDKEKCSCWQLTIEGQKLIPGNVIDPNVGYNYRRLTERVITGIYECNDRCKCSKRTCLNRVVQHPLSQKLQLFKTEMKGWGIRCINDIPQGAFICVYAGHLLTEQEANEEGKTYGDEYLAELDYIEVIERMKEDYESDVAEELLEETELEKQQFPSRSNGHKSHSPDSSSEEEMEVETETSENNIRSRLRERKKPPAPLPKPETKSNSEEKKKEQFSIRKYYGDNVDDVFIMDAKGSGNIGRYLNHSCMPNVFVQNVFVDTHDLRFPWVAFFALTHITAGTELTWDYNYDIGSVDGKVKYCYCGSQQCRGRLL